MKSLEDLSGKTFNNWVVIKKHNEKGNGGKTLWLCECQCENKTKRLISTGDLKRNRPKSCGCLDKKLRLQALHKSYLNEYYFENDDCIIIANNTKNKFYIDKEDYDKIKDYCWYETKRGYLATTINRKTVMLHRMIMGLELENYKKVIVDHILHTDDGKNSFTNNRKSNLRITTQDKNVLNRGVLKSNTSGITGVSWNKNDNVWFAYITYNKKRMHLGRFKKIEDAAKARKEAEEKYFGEFSYDNSMKGVEQNEN